LPARWGRRRPDAEGAAAGAYIQGFSTRSVDALAEALGLKSISKDQVSRQLRRELLRYLNRQRPNAAAKPAGAARRRPVSKSFYRLLSPAPHQLCLTRHWLASLDLQHHPKRHAPTAPCASFGLGGVGIGGLVRRDA